MKINSNERPILKIKYVKVFIHFIFELIISFGKELGLLSNGFEVNEWEIFSFFD